MMEEILQHLGCKIRKNLSKNGTKYQTQLVGRTSEPSTVVGDSGMIVDDTYQNFQLSFC